jgi:hypothetical protein
MFNMKYSILDYGRLGTRAKGFIKKIMSDKKLPHFFATPPASFNYEDTVYNVIEFKRVRFMKHYLVLTP